MNELAFTNPNLLWGLWSAALPLILHLINRHRARQKPFAAIDFLLRVKRRSARRILLKQVLLLITRTLLLAVLVVAAAGPVLRPNEIAASAGPATTVLVLDRSFSMQWREQGKSLFERAKKSAEEFVRQSAPGDRFCLVAAGAKEEILAQPCLDSHSALRDALDRVEVSNGTSNLTRAMEVAAELAAKHPQTRHRILLVSDGAKHAFLGPPRFPAQEGPPEVLLENLASSNARGNHAVTRVTQRPNGKLIEIKGEVASYSDAAASNLWVEVRQKDQPIAKGFVNLEPEGTSHKTFNIPSPPNQLHLGSFQLEPDGLSPDDQVPLYFSRSAQVQVLLLDGDMQSVLQQDELFYAERALSPSQDSSSGINYTVVTPDSFQEKMLANVSVLVLANVRELSPDNVTAIRRFVSAGGGLLLAMGDHVNVDRTNTLFADLLPWRIRDVVSLGTAETQGQPQGLPFSEPNLDHPIFSIFKENEARSMSAVRTWRAVVLEPGATASDAKVLLHYQNGAPALVVGSHGSGKVMVYTSSLDRDWTSWPARGSFVPFLQRACFFLAGRLGEEPPPEVTVGDAIRFRLLPEADGARITRPDGTDRTLAAEAISGGLATYRDTQLLGWHQIEQLRNHQPLPGLTVPGFIVRAPLAESNLRPISQDELQDLLGRQIPLRLVGASNPAYQSLSSYLLWLALMLLLVEALLTRR